MTKAAITPDYIFEASWEVCNKVGGIYTVLSTRAKTLQALFPDRLIFIGPDLRATNDEFVEEESLPAAWKHHAQEQDKLNVRTGRWRIPGSPIVVLVDFLPFYREKDIIYYRMWEKYGIDSTVAYGDYDEASLFAYAAGRVMESLAAFLPLANGRVVAHLNEWMLGMAALYLHDRAPQIATVFTTHATSIGRSICGNGKPLYGELAHYNGDQMADELHVAGKHALEKQAALHVECFTTVSRITGRESEQLLGKKPDVITPNGFEPNFVPKGKRYAAQRVAARALFRRVAEQLTGTAVADDALLVATSGRYEYRNKGLDVFIEALHRVKLAEPAREVVAFMLVPAGIVGARGDLQARLQGSAPAAEALPDPYITHSLSAPESDSVIQYLKYLGFTNREASPVRFIFVPSYLNGDDGIFNCTYYDLLPGLDMTVFPSYYEPWGYTPLESIAFRVPTITTQLAGFGLWAQEEQGVGDDMPAVTIVQRTDDNYFDVAEAIRTAILRFAQCDTQTVAAVRKKAAALAEKADWAHFIRYYLEAYSLAFYKHI
jgi:glycosyltransferase involved in cell wall biosynthesis